jgi:ParB family transcriptional regulator, chromosome partitioning protein
MTDLAIPLERLRPKRHQPRRASERIAELADSIARDGLYRSLVVRAADADGTFEIVAGERRYRALWLLRRDGRLKAPHVPCFVVRSEAELSDELAALPRHDVRLWEIGRSLLAFNEAGMTQAQIAARIGRTQSYVSTAIILARDLAPAVVAQLAQLPHGRLSGQRLLRLATLLDEHDEPDEHAQLRFLQSMLEAPPRSHQATTRTRREKDTVWDRYQRLKLGRVGRIDPVYLPFLDAVLKYLSGSNRGIST